MRCAHLALLFALSALAPVSRGTPGTDLLVAIVILYKPIAYFVHILVGLQATMNIP